MSLYVWYAYYMTNTENATDLNGYIVYVEREKFEVYAKTSFAAQCIALGKAKSRKKYPTVSVNLCELAGEQVTTVIDY